MGLGGKYEHTRSPGRRKLCIPCVNIAYRAWESGSFCLTVLSLLSLTGSPLHHQDAFHGVGDDDSLLIKANENENELKELRTFTDLIHSKNKVRMAKKFHRGARICAVLKGWESFFKYSLAQLNNSVGIRATWICVSPSLNGVRAVSSVSSDADNRK